MDIIEIRNYCLAMPGSSEYYPFDEVTMALRVGPKIFLFISTDSIPLRFSAKCAPEEALELRERYESIIPGYHTNKKHWNTVILDGSISDDLIQKLINNSYDLVFASLKKAEKAAILGE